MKKFLLASTALGMLAGISAASAADLPSRSMAPVAPAYIPPAFTWTGFYVGVNAGYNFTNSDKNDGFGSFGGGGSNGGFIGGAQVGYNYQFGIGSGFVIGAETDIQYVDVGGNHAFGGSTFAAYPGTVFYGGSGSDGNYLGTVRARAGYAFDRFLVYATGGLAYGDIGGNRGTSYAVTAAGGSLPYGGIAAATTTTYFGNSNGGSTRTGYTLGGGLEYAFTQNLTVKAEYLYYNLGHSGSGSGFTPFYGSNHHDADGNIVRVGLNYKFW